MKPMRRYLGPGLLLTASMAVLGLWAGGPAELAIAAYVAGAVWWIIAGARADSGLGRHLVMVWAPAVPPLALLVRAAWTFAHDDTAFLGLTAIISAAVVALVASACGAGVLVLRMADASVRTGAGGR
jgi:hypothetical protein